MSCPVLRSWVRMSEKISRAVRPDFAEPWRMEDLRARYDYHCEITGAEAELILGWSRDRLKTHHKNHPKRIPRKLAKSNEKGWNRYWLGEVLDALEEEILWQLEQRQDRRPLSDVQRRNREAAKDRDRQIQKISEVVNPWLRGAKFATWVAMARATDEWPVVKRRSGVLGDFFDAIGTIKPGDRVVWISLQDYLLDIQKFQNLMRENAQRD
jgi:hypothetical protein